MNSYLKIIVGIILVSLSTFANSGNQIENITDPKKAQSIIEEMGRCGINGIGCEKERSTDVTVQSADIQSCEWDCQKKCCTKVFGTLVCEPGCKSVCETHNLGCAPITTCSAIRALDPNYDSLKELWQSARNKEIFKNKEGCIAQAEKGAAAVSAICQALNTTVVGGIACSAFNYVGKEENLCFCDEIQY